MKKSSWVILGGPKCTHSCPYKTEAERDVMTEEGSLIVEAGLEKVVQ